MDSRLQKQITRSKLSHFFNCATLISFLLLLILAFTNLKFLFIFCGVFSAIVTILAIEFEKTDTVIFKATYEKLKSINWWKDRLYSINGAIVSIYGYGAESVIEIGIPDLTGAKLEFSKGRVKMSDAMRIALDERGVSPYEFYLKYIEMDLLNCMTTTYNEINANKIRAGNCVLEFIDKRDSAK